MERRPLYLRNALRLSFSVELPKELIAFDGPLTTLARADKPKLAVIHFPNQSDAIPASAGFVDPAIAMSGCHPHHTPKASKARATAERPTTASECCASDSPSDFPGAAVNMESRFLSTVFSISMICFESGLMGAENRLASRDSSFSSASDNCASLESLSAKVLTFLFSLSNRLRYSS